MSFGFQELENQTNFDFPSLTKDHAISSSVSCTVDSNPTTGINNWFTNKMEKQKLFQTKSGAHMARAASSGIQ